MQEPDESTTPYKQPRVDGTSNGYIISNGVSGIYHTGSRSKLYVNDAEDGLYDAAPQQPTKQLNGDVTRQHDSSIFSEFICIVDQKMSFYFSL